MCVSNWKNTLWGINKYTTNSVAYWFESMIFVFWQDCIDLIAFYLCWLTIFCNNSLFTSSSYLDYNVVKWKIKIKCVSWPKRIRILTIISLNNRGLKPTDKKISLKIILSLITNVASPENNFFLFLRNFTLESHTFTVVLIYIGFYNFVLYEIAPMDCFILICKL